MNDARGPVPEVEPSGGDPGESPGAGRPEADAWPLYALVVFGVAFFAPTVVAGILLAIRRAGSRDDLATEVAIAAGPILGILLASGTVWATRRCSLELADIGWRFPRGRRAARDVGLGVLVAGGILVLGVPYGMLLRALHLNSDLLAPFAGGRESPFLAVMLTITALVAAPLGEELFHRGFLLSVLSPRVRAPWVAVVVVSLVWAAEHFSNPSAMPLLFAFGVGLAVVRLRTASLLAPLAAHVVNNAVGVAVLLFA